MSVEAMTQVTLSGPENMVEAALQKLVLGREFHPENAVEALAPVKKLLPFEGANPYSEPLSRSKELLSALDLTPQYRGFESEELSVEAAAAYLDELLQKIAAIGDERGEKLEKIQNGAVFIQELSHFESFDVELSSLFDMRYLKFRFGRIAADMNKECAELMSRRPDVYYIPAGKCDRWVYGAYFALPQEHTQVDALFASMGFERIHIDVDSYADCTAHEAVERLKAECERDEKRISELDEELKQLKSAESEKALKIYSWLRLCCEAYELRSLAGCRHGKFFIVGWVPKAQAEAYAKECESFPGFVCILSTPRDLKEASPPVKLKKGFFSGIYQPFVEMYGFPAYGELDPRLFMAITYTLLFGIMFGDVGQGVLLVATGLLLYKLKGSWLGRIVAMCGVSATLFGFVYGSVFGSEELLPGFKVLEDGNTMKILLVAVAVGVVLMLACMVLNIITGIRQKDIKKIFFDPNGLAGFVMYMAVAVGAVFMLVFDKNIMTPAYIWLLIVLPLFLIFAATPITKLLTGQKDWMPESVGMFVVEGFFELFETLLSYVSNTVSFLRVGAFAISHAGMMMVVYLLSAGSDGYSIGGLIFGNLLVTGLEAVLVCIQVMRLEFYEMFGRFYKSGGEKFSPRMIDYTAAD